MTNDWRDKYDWVDHFFEGLARVQLNGKYGFVDQQGKEVVPPKYDWVWEFREGLAVVYLNDKVGWVTLEGKELLLPKDKYIQIKNLVELGKITKKQLFN